MKRVENSLDTKQVLTVVERYSQALHLLDAYDHQNMMRPKGNWATYIKDLRNDSFDIFREQAVKSKRLDEPDIQVSNEQLLDRLNLINEGLLTRAAILLFHHNPEKWFPGSYVKIAYFQSESDILYQDEVHGSLLSQADRVVDLI